jgi:aminopeptidase C
LKNFIIFIYYKYKIINVDIYIQPKNTVQSINLNIVIQNSLQDKIKKLRKLRKKKLEHLYGTN